MTQRGFPGSRIPMYRIDKMGIATQIAEIEWLGDEGCNISFDQFVDWPMLDSGQRQAFPGIPYFLEDMRPQGFLGRQFALRHTVEMKLPRAPDDWTDGDILAALTSHGADQVGDLVIGEEAYRQYLLSTRQGLQFVRDDEVANIYLALAEQTLDDGASRALVGGEFPKLTAARWIDDEPHHVIVKHSEADGSSGSQRWSDLLVCEHIASRILPTELGIDAARSSIFQAGGRTFLEVVRFDRHGAFGRSPACSWFALNAGVIGLAGDPWPKGAAILQQSGWLDADAVAAVEKIWHFGRLISNTDMHDGNLSFVPGLVVAPVYDMLPMAYAPQRGVEIVGREYLPLVPLSSEAPAWSAAARAATVFWQQAAEDQRISAPFRAICRRNAERLTSIVGRC